MKKINVGRSPQIIGNVGIIAGNVFLALELPQNNFCGRKPVPDTSRRLSRLESPGMVTAVLSTYDN